MRFLTLYLTRIVSRSKCKNPPNQLDLAGFYVLQRPLTSAGRLKWIVATTHLEVEVGAGRAAGGADCSNSLAGLYVLTDTNVVLGVVRIECLYAIRVADDDVVSVATIPSGISRYDNFTGSGGADRCAMSGAKVNGVKPV